MLKILRHISTLCLLSAVVFASEPYCVRNESIITRIPVTKTREVIKKPTGFFKTFKKSKMYIEKFEDFEDHVQIKLVRSCCDGYSMSRFNICEPICTSGCPANAHCVEPNRCQCQGGYISGISPKNGSHYCEPICKGGCPPNARCAEPDVCECERGYHTVNYRCEPRCASGCPFGGVCIHPDQCRCEEGYKAEKGTCVPMCTAGNGCLNGRCVDKEKCICNKGFKLDGDSEICIQNIGYDISDIEYELDTTTGVNFEASEEEEQVTDDSVELELDGEEKIFLTTPSDYTVDADYSDVPDSTTHHSKCPPNFIFYENICRPKIFASNEVDCRFKPCVEHAFCQVNGTCSCLEGYNWYKPYRGVEPTTSEEEPTVCLTLEEIEERLKAARMTEIEPEHNMDWLSGCFIALGVLCMVGALCFLTFKLLRHRNGKMEVEVKNDLYCTYDNKNSRDVPLVL